MTPSMQTPSYAIDPVIANAPLRIGKVALVVGDLGAVSSFYQRAFGLRAIEQERRVVRLGAGNLILLELCHDPAARPQSRRDAGLFHTAFLLPHRTELGSWLGFAREEHLPLIGAADHRVSEAIYLEWHRGLCRPAEL